MRCQRVRYYLSAYCRNELSGGRRKAIAAHLECCSDCRREEAVFREMSGAISGLAQHAVSADFNARLLNRIAAERFKETRSRAYLPKKIPVLTWWRAVPVIATACFVLAFVFSGGLDKLHLQDETAVTVAGERQDGNLDNSYLTVQPQEQNRTFASHANAGWAFQKQVDRASRIRGIMTSLAGQTSFGRRSIASSGGPYIIFSPGYFAGLGERMAPLTGASNATLVKEANQTY